MATKLDPPKGCKPIFIQMKNLEKYGLKTGPGMNDCVSHKLISRKAILDEIQAFGVYCDFQCLHKEINSYPEEEFLLVFDGEQKYGDAWLLVYSVEAKDQQLAGARAKLEAQEAERRAKEEEEALKKAAEEARLNAVYKEKPIIPRAYNSGTSQETLQEISALNVRSKRELYGLSISRPRGSFRKPFSFGDRDAGIDGVIEFRSHKDPAFDLSRKEADIGLQAAPSTESLCTQTTWYRPVNKATQFESSNHINKDNVASSKKDADTSTSSPERSGKAHAPKAEDRIAGFLQRVKGQMEEALQQNETVNIFQDALKLLGDDDTHVGKKGENELKELRAFSSLLYSKNKPLTAIDWHPKKRGMIAVSPTRQLSFNQRIDVDGMVSTSYILLWDFVDFSSPQFVLQAPQEIFTFRFNPFQPNLIIGGSATGQVVLWDISGALELVNKKKTRSGQRNVSSNQDEEEEDKAIPPVLPISISHIDSSHKSAVADICWLPPQIQVNFRGTLVSEEHNDGNAYQFITIAHDGQVLIWDVRYENIAEGALPHIAKPRVTGGDKASKDQHIRPPWVPLYRLQLKRPEGVGELSLCRMAPAYGYPDGTVLPGENESMKTKLFLATEEGEFLCADWTVRNSGGANAAKGEEGGDETSSEGNAVEWMLYDHPRPCVSMQKSPFFPDIFLTVGDWNFRLWKTDNHIPIFTSPNASTYLTAGRWSITRPGVLFIAKVDGSLDVWDLTDTSYKPSLNLMCGPSRISSMEFLRANMNTSKQQLLSVGDANGNLHIFDLPRNLWKPAVNEKVLIQQFFDREFKKVNYTSERLEYRLQQAEVVAKETEAAAQTEAPAHENKEDQKTDDVVKEDPEVLAMQALYSELEAKFIQDLGLTPEDLPAGFTMFKEDNKALKAKK